MRVFDRRALGTALGLAFVLGSVTAVASETPSGLAEMRALGRCAGCVLENDDYSGHRLTSIALRDATLTDVRLEGAQLNLAVFENTILTRVSFAGANLSGASFVGAQLIDVSFEGANLRGAVFEGARLERTQLDAAHLCNTQTPADEMDNSDCDATWESPAAHPRPVNASPEGIGQ